MRENIDFNDDRAEKAAAEARGKSEWLDYEWRAVLYKKTSKAKSKDPNTVRGVSRMFAGTRRSTYRWVRLALGVGSLSSARSRTKIRHEYEGKEWVHEGTYSSVLCFDKTWPTCWGVQVEKKKVPRHEWV